MTLRKVLQANGRKVMIPSSQIWDSAQRNIPSYRRHGNGNGYGCSMMEGFVNGFTEYIRRQKSISDSMKSAVYIPYHGGDLNIARRIKTIQEQTI